MAIINGVGRVGIRNYVPINNPLWDNLVSYYSADDTSNDSKGTNNGTLVNGATYATGKINNGFSLDGINDYVSFADNSWNYTGDFSMSFWIKPTNSLGYQYVIENFNYAGNFYGWMVLLTNNQIRFEMYTGTGGFGPLLVTDAYINTGAWNHVVISRVGSTGTKIYINGVLRASDSNTINPVYHPTRNYSRFGAETIDGGANYYHYNGSLDEVGIWNKALTAAEVTELYSAGVGKQYVAPTPTAPTYPTSLKLFIDAGNPLSYAGTGTTVTDLIGTQNGTLLNGTGWSSSNGGTFTFDGVNDYISFPTNSANLTGDFSISIAFNSAINNGNFVLFTNYLYSGGLNYGYKIALRDDNVIRFAIYNGGSGALNLISTTTYSPNVWYHVVITRKSGNRTRMYINGVINSSDTNTINPVYIGTNYPTVGVSQYQSGVFEQYSNAKIQEIGIFDKELTESEVLADFNQFKSRYGY